MGAFAFTVLRRDRASWVITVALTGAALGATRLVGENIANLLNLTLEVGALVILISARDRRRAIGGAILMLVAAGLAHWVFLGVFEATLAIVFLLSRPSRSPIDQARLRAASDARSVAVVGIVAAAALGVLILAVLRAPLSTFEIQLNPLEFAAKLLTDVARLWPLGLLALIGLVPVALARRVPGEWELAERPLGLRFIVAWAVVSVAGVLVGLVGIRFNSTLSLPPHRFLALLAAFPGVVLAGAGVRWATEKIPRRISPRFGRWPSKVLPAAIGLAAITLVAVPTVIRWYSYPVLMGSLALKQAHVASEYVEGLPPGQPFVVVVGPDWPGNDYAAPLRERMIRMELSGDRQAGLHMFPGDPADLLAGRRTIPPYPLANKVTLPYWRDVSAILPSRPPVLVLQAMGQSEFAQALSLRARVIAPGVALLRGPSPEGRFVDDPAPDASVTPSLVLLGLAVLALVWVAGTGWARFVLASNAAPEVWISLAPVIGLGALLLGAFAATELGVRMAGPGGPITYAVVTVVGLALAWLPHRLR